MADSPQRLLDQGKVLQRSKGIGETILKRTLSALVLLAVFLGALLMGPAYTAALVILAGLISVGEWVVLCFRAPSFSLFSKISWMFFGSFFIGGGFLIYLQFIQDIFGFAIALIVLVSINDIAAYLVGSRLKGPKLAPSISPNKTWSGSLGGVFAVVVCAETFLYLKNGFFSGGFGMICAGLAIIGQAGDLIESWAKRRLEVKDSSKLIPGHGGFLDRMDAILAVSWGAMIIFLFLFHKGQGFGLFSH